jgi:hypothetical protein
VLCNAALCQVSGLGHAAHVLEWAQGFLGLCLGLEHFMIMGSLLGLFAAIAHFFVG